MTVRLVRMPIEIESPEEYGCARIRNNLSESSIVDRKLSDLGLSIPDLTLHYHDHRGSPALRELIVAGESGLRADPVVELEAGLRGISRALRG